MKTPSSFSLRHLILAIATTFVSAGIAFAAVCQKCGGSGTGSFTCFQCKGTGQLGGIKCAFCNGKGFTKCPYCNGTGQTR